MENIEKLDISKEYVPHTIICGDFPNSKIICPKCGKKYELDNSYVYAEFQCPNCSAFLCYDWLDLELEKPVTYLAPIQIIEGEIYLAKKIGMIYPEEDEEK